jgi:hypothetical protein
MEGEDTEGHTLRARFEDTGPEADVEGHSFRYKLDVGVRRRGSHLAHLEGAEVTGKDAEGSAWTLRFDRVEDDDVQAHLFKIK